MRLVDQQGRVFGRWNVIDVIIGLILLLVIPVMYSAYWLFRPAPASLSKVEPSRIAAHADAEVMVTGSNLRPYMRVSFNDIQGNGFFFADASRARVPIQGLPAGVYDVVLYDQRRELSRLPQAVQVVGPPSRGTQVDLVGRFTAITAEQADRLTSGLAMPGLGSITRIGKRAPSLTLAAIASGVAAEIPSKNAFNVAAIVRTDCTLSERAGSVTCNALDTPLLEGLVVKVLDSGGDLLFQIDQVLMPVPTTPLTVRVRLGGDRAAVERMRVGHRNVRGLNELATYGSIVALDAVRAASPGIAVALGPPQGPPTLPFVVADLAVRDTTLTAPAQQIGDSWYYAGRRLTIGSPVEFHGPDYELRGTVLSIGTPGAPRE